MRRTALALMPLARAIRSAVQWVVSVGGSANVSATTRSATSGPCPGTREGRVLSRRRPSTPSSMNRCCQRQTQVFDVPVWRMISLVRTPSALRSTIFARQTCFCEALRSLAIASSRWRFGRVILMEIPVRMRKTRTRTKQMESLRDSYVRQRPLGMMQPHLDGLYLDEIDKALIGAIAAARREVATVINGRKLATTASVATVKRDLTALSSVLGF